MRAHVFTSFAVCILFATAAHTKPKLVDTPLKSGGNVPSVVAQKLGAKFKTVVRKSTDPVGNTAVERALKKLRLPNACQTVACGQKLASEFGARFVLFTSLSNEDDTYSVTLKLYDFSAKGFVVETKKECEFCAAKEVEGTFISAWKIVKEALSKPATKPQPKAPKTVSILTIPPGATVVVDGKKQDQRSPIEVKLEAGSHTVEVRLEGYVSAKRNLQIGEDEVELPVIEMVKRSQLATDESPVIPNKTSSIYGVSLGMLITGAILSGTGLWLIAKDGSVVCTDGRGRTACPEVYNTKYIGFASGSVGALLIGASSAMLLKDYIDIDTPDTNGRVSISPNLSGGGMNLGWGRSF